jgi:hypothetical protein
LLSSIQKLIYTIVSKSMTLYTNANTIAVTAVCMLSYSSNYDVEGKLRARHMRKKTKMLLESAKAPI